MTKSVGGKLRNAPLVYALCQVRFSSVLSIEEYVPAIQERIRKAFPRFNKEVLQFLKVSHPGETLEPSVANRWTFVNKENTAGFILNADALVFHTTDYKRFADFAENLAKGLEVIAEILDISLVERIGLRYIDFIEPKEPLSIRNYVHEQLSGFRHEEIGFGEISQRHESRCATPAGQMTIRYSQAQHDAVIPHDLLPISLRLDKNAPAGEVTGVLDTDHYWQEGDDFDVERIMERLSKLHDHTNAAFCASVTKEALESWR
jgi:uncharacterized protein (TIGR04255 family)